MSIIPSSGEAYNAFKTIGNSFAGMPARELLKSMRGPGSHSADKEAFQAGIITTAAGLGVAEHIYQTTNDY